MTTPDLLEKLLDDVIYVANTLDPWTFTSQEAAKRWADKLRAGRTAILSQSRMSVSDAEYELNAISGDDPETARGRADDILLKCVPPEVEQAYRALADRCSWWATA